MKKKILNLEEKLLLNKIAGYSVLAGAALLLTPTVAKGDIVYVDPADIVVNNIHSLDTLDLDANGENDFILKHLRSSSTSIFIYSTLKMSGYYNNWTQTNKVLISNYFVAKLDSSVSISPAQTNWASDDEFCNLEYTYTGPSTFLRGNWAPNVEEKFLGVSFYIGVMRHYGWIRASVIRLGDGNGGQITVHDWAYEDDEGVSLKTGEGDVPLPSNYHILLP